jgi:hypothetical protein
VECGLVSTDVLHCPPRQNRPRKVSGDSNGRLFPLSLSLLFPLSLFCLFFLCWEGEVSELVACRLLSLDARIVPTMLARLDPVNADIQALLIQMILTYLYQKGSLDLDLLQTIGGIHFIIDQYLRAKNYDTRDNLFSILMDYVIKNLIGTKQIEFLEPDRSVSTIYELVRSFDAPNYLAQIFKVVPKSFSRKIMKCYEGICTKAEKDLLDKIFSEGFEGLALRHCKVAFFFIFVFVFGVCVCFLLSPPSPSLFATYSCNRNLKRGSERCRRKEKSLITLLR